MLIADVAVSAIADDEGSASLLAGTLLKAVAKAP
jgi:hypothetical protein